METEKRKKSAIHFAVPVTDLFVDQWDLGTCLCWDGLCRFQREQWDIRVAETGWQDLFAYFYHDNICRMVSFLIIFHADGLCLLCWDELKLNTTIFALLISMGNVAALARSGHGVSVQWGFTYTSPTQFYWWIFSRLLAWYFSKWAEWLFGTCLCWLHWAQFQISPNPLMNLY